MILFPAIDILDNRAVRLLYGKRDMVTDYGKPVDRALKWIDEGAEYLHIVDLNAAFDNSIVNQPSIKEIVKNVRVPVQLGGGIRDIDKVSRYIEDYGITRVIIGTAAVTDNDFLEKATYLYKDKIVCGIDVLDNKVAIKGWVDKVNLTALELGIKAKSYGINTIVYTDISRDGALSGVNIEATVKLSDELGINIIASGGLKSQDEVFKLKEKNVYGAILGRSIYEGSINLKSLSESIKNSK